VSQKVMVELALPGDLRHFRMPPFLQKRLKGLLDKQDCDGRLPVAERREAKALVEVSQILTLLKLRALRAKGRKGDSR